MDLTPPLTRSPASPPNSHCPSDRSSLGYPSPELVAQQYKLSSIYGQPCSMAQPLDADTSLPPLDTMTMGQPEWSQAATVMQTSSASSAVPSIISSDYDGFGGYEASPMNATPAPYGSHHDVYGTHAGHSQAQHHAHQNTSPPPPPPPSHSRSPIAGHPRASSLSYTQPLTPRVKMEGAQQPGDYAPGVEITHYPSPRSIHAPYPGDSSGNSTNSGSGVGAYPPPAGSGYLSDTQSSAWSKDYQSTDPVDHFYPALNGPQQPIGFVQNRRTLRPGRPRARKRLTTKEEANFQCEVKGCGKLFSRSYNFKAHMETHDEKREYPFPCSFNDCDRRFVRKTDMVRHRQSVHDKQRNHKCDYCGRPFARKDTLRRHMEDGCSKRFDIGTMDLRADGYDTLNPGLRSVGAAMSHLVPPHGALPPMAIPPMNTGGMLAPISAPIRSSRDIMQGGDQNPGGQHWGR